MPVNKDVNVDEILAAVVNASEAVSVGEITPAQFEEMIANAKQLIHAREADAFKAGVAMSGGDLEFQDAFYEQWQLNLKHTQSQLKENKEE